MPKTRLALPPDKIMIAIKKEIFMMINYIKNMPSLYFPEGIGHCMFRFVFVKVMPLRGCSLPFVAHKP